jgi:rhamnogalacturonyl hydrolase YesR
MQTTKESLMGPYRRWSASLLFTTLVAMLVAVPGTAAAAPVTATTALPRHSDVVAAMVKAANYYRGTYPVTTLTSPKNGWSWSTYFQGAHFLYLEQGDPKYLADGMAWGRSNNWSPSTERNPDSVKSLQTYFDLNLIDPSASLTTANQKMATDLASLPVTQYDWADAHFMGLPNWTRWSEKFQTNTYRQKMDDLYFWSRDLGGTSSRCSGQTVPKPGLFDATYGLWYRDCTFIGKMDSTGKPIFWSRGNGWVIAAMAQVIATLPRGEDFPEDLNQPYVEMLQTMAATLKPLQGSDGLWRSNLLNASQYPQAETSGTALIAYAVSYGIRAGLLDKVTYLPVVAKAWTGLNSYLASNGFLRNCQPPGVGPAASYTGTGPRTAPTSTSSGTVNTDSPPYCVGAFLLFGSEFAKLTYNQALGVQVAATGQQGGNEAYRAVDGRVNTRWSASGFPKSLTVDLGNVLPVSNTLVVPHQGRAYQYRIETSTDNATWRVVVNKTTNTTPGTALDNVTGGRVLARYVRLTVTGVSGTSTTWASIEEFGVYDRVFPSIDWARSRPTTATSAQSGAPATRATDGDLATWWSATAVPTVTRPQNLTVNLIAALQVDNVTWFSRSGSGPRTVNVQVSTNGTTFTTVATVSIANSEGPWTVLFPRVSASHVRLNITASHSTSTVSVEQLEVNTIYTS